MEILDKAVDLFWEKGYTATSANDLVKGLGLSRSSLYSTYKDKRTLYVRALNRYRQRNVDAMLQLVRESDDMLATIEQIFNLVVEQDIHSKIPKGCLMVNSSIELGPHDEQIAEIVNQNEKNIEDAFEAAILKGQKNGQIAPSHSAKSLARFIYNNISGLRVAVKTKADRSILDDVINVSMSVLK